MKKFLFFIALFAAFWSCNKMDSTYRQFLEGEARIYTEKPDSLKAHSGRNRVRVTWKPIRDPRVSKVVVTWNNDAFSKEAPITSPADTSIIIDGLTEGNYSFNFYTLDNEGNRSIKTEVLGQAYDTLYEKGLILRDVTSVSSTGSELTIHFQPFQGGDTYLEQEVVYTSSLTNQQKAVQLPAEGEALTIADFTGTGFTHRSVYRPQELSPDLFYSVSRTVFTPQNPLPDYPQNNAVGISVAPTFTWYNSILMPTATYRVLYSTDGANWTTATASQSQQFTPVSLLAPNTQYFWKVTATSGATVRESPVQSFTTGAKNVYADGEATRIQQSSSGFNPVQLIFTGDGFQQSDYTYDGEFDRYINQAVEAFFSVEPYKSYRQYFEVWKVAAYSVDAGVSEADQSVSMNTAFNATYTGSTITCNTTNVFNYAKKVAGIDDAALSNTPVIVLLNRKRIGGASLVTNDKRSIALVPVYTSAAANLYSNLKDVIIRQAGGFCFGLLADESSNTTGTLSAAQITQLQGEWAVGRSLNVDLTGNASSVRWAHFIGRSGYTRPAVYEGAYGYKTAIYRSEEQSAMSNGLNYFNAISRELIVKRILSIAGQPYSLEQFIEKDIAKNPY